MPARLMRFYATKDAFRPCLTTGARWWGHDDWAAARAAAEGMWPGGEYWAESEWHELYREGYRYCALLVDGHSVATAGLWPCAQAEWEVIAVAAAPAHRNRGHGSAIVSFVAEEILTHGRIATITTREDNLPMLRVIERLGFRPKPSPPADGQPASKGAVP